MRHSASPEPEPENSLVESGPLQNRARARARCAGMLNADLLEQLQEFLNQLTRDAPDIVPLEAIVVHGHKRAIG